METSLGTNPAGKVSKAKESDRKSASLAGKYNLRTKSIQNRIEVERRKNEPRHPKPKQRPAPLSKYRRRTANFRERCRMQVRGWLKNPLIFCQSWLYRVCLRLQEMNDAFKRLQGAVPDLFAADEPVDNSDLASVSKATKINTLKLAVNYISALQSLLNQNESPSHISVTHSERACDEPLLAAHSATSAKGSMSAMCPSGRSRASANCVSSQQQQQHAKSRYNDLNAHQLECQMIPFAYETCARSDGPLPQSSKVTSVPFATSYQRSNCEISPIFGYTSTSGHMSMSGAVPCGPAVYPSETCLFNPPTLMTQPEPDPTSFDLSYSLSNDGQALLDDFSAIIEDLQEDSFSLVDGLLD